MGFLLESLVFLVFDLCMSHHARQMQALLEGLEFKIYQYQHSTVASQIRAESIPPGVSS